MSKSELKKQINKLLIGGAGPEVVFYFDGSYKIGQCGRLTDITQPEAIQYMRARGHQVAAHTNPGIQNPK